jgi:hypothetical protein
MGWHRAEICVNQNRGVQPNGKREAVQQLRLTSDQSASSHFSDQKLRTSDDVAALLLASPRLAASLPLKKLLPARASLSWPSHLSM